LEKILSGKDLDIKIIGLPTSPTMKIESDDGLAEIIAWLAARDCNENCVSGRSFIYCTSSFR